LLRNTRKELFGRGRNMRFFRAFRVACGEHRRVIRSLIVLHPLFCQMRCTCFAFFAFTTRYPNGAPVARIGEVRRTGTRQTGPAARLRREWQDSCLPLPEKRRRRAGIMRDLGGPIRVTSGIVASIVRILPFPSPTPRIRPFGHLCPSVLGQGHGAGILTTNQ
jgi:hypothetical protein